VGGLRPYGAFFAISLLSSDPGQSQPWKGKGKFRCGASPFEPFTQEVLSLLGSLGQTEDGALGIFVLGSTNLAFLSQWLNFICSPVSTHIK